MKKIILPFVFVLTIQFLSGQSVSTPSDSIFSYFEDAKQATRKASNLWNLDLYGPMLLVNPATRQLYANYPDSADILILKKKIYEGYLPVEINIANTAINWNGRRWAMVLLPLPEKKTDRINLLAHELFHRVQPSLGFNFLNIDNNHLDQKNGRIYLRLELEALKKAINTITRTEMRESLKDAISFRKYRHSLYPGSDSSENILELHEGLAEYTGFIVSGRNKKQAQDHFTESIKNFLLNPTYVRSFAYQTWPVYGYFLQQQMPGWNKKLNSTTKLTDFFINTLHIPVADNLKKYVTTILPKYSGQMIIEEEIAREEKIKKMIVEYKSKFIEQPHLDIFFEQMNISFDPGNIMPLEDKGTVYPNMRISDKWGILTVEKGALMAPGWDRISVSIPIKTTGKTISGDGWTLVLNSRYQLIKKEENGNYQIVKTN